MMLQILTPGMEYGDEADLRAQVFGSCCDRAQGFGCGMCIFWLNLNTHYEPI
jgi:hypothetical protein